MLIQEEQQGTGLTPSWIIVMNEFVFDDDRMDLSNCKWQLLIAKKVSSLP